MCLNDCVDARIPRNQVVGAIFNNSEQQTDKKDDDL